MLKMKNKNIPLATESNSGCCWREMLGGQGGRCWVVREGEVWPA